MKKIIICILLCALFLAGCENIFEDSITDLNDSYLLDEEIENDDDAAVFDETRLFVKTVEYVMCHEYFICYRNPDGSETEIVKMGLQQNPFHVIGERIYFTEGDALYSVDFNGGDKQYLSDRSDDYYSFNLIERVEGDWLLCSGTKWKEIYGDPVALNGLRRVSFT
jgi:hypothetical protein